LYGSVFWNVCDGYVERVCCAWRVDIRHVPPNAHSVLLSFFVLLFAHIHTEKF